MQRSCCIAKMETNTILEPLHAAVHTLCSGEGGADPPAAAVDALRAAVSSLAAARPPLEQGEAEGVWRSCCELWVSALAVAMRGVGPNGRSIIRTAVVELAPLACASRDDARQVASAR